MRLPSFLSACVLLATSVLAQDNMGVHSDHFDARKYALPDRLLITPRSHPELFAFTGRWLRSPTAHPHAPAYHATLWPGNSVTILFHGDQASLKLLPKPQGPVERYYFVVSLDGGEDIRYDVPGFNTSAPGKDGHIIPIEVVKPAPDVVRRDLEAGQESAPIPDQKVLKPHVMRITSMPETPLSFHGLLVENTQISQGSAWRDNQARRITIEFIGEGSDAERPGGFFKTDKYAAPPGREIEEPITSLFSTVQYRLAETLGVVHHHISAGTCLISNCDARGLPGLETQYFQTSPLNHQGKTPEVKNKWDPRHIENLQSPFRFPAVSSSPTVRTMTASHVVVDAGILDILIAGQDPAKYAHTLMVFLARLRNQAHPDAKVLVVAHSGTPPRGQTSLSDSVENSTKRRQLYIATKSAVEALRDPNMALLDVKPAPNMERAYLKALCPHLVPSASSWWGHADHGRITKTQKVCMAAKKGQGHSSKGWVWGFLIVGALGTGLWMGRSTVIGAVAAVVGRKRLGLREEEVRLVSEMVEERKMG